MSWCQRWPDIYVCRGSMASKCWTPSVLADDSTKQSLADLERHAAVPDEKRPPPALPCARAVTTLRDRGARFAEATQAGSQFVLPTSAMTLPSTFDGTGFHLQKRLTRWRTRSQRKSGRFEAVKLCFVSRYETSFWERRLGTSEQFARGRRWKNFLALMGC